MDKKRTRPAHSRRAEEQPSGPSDPEEPGALLRESRGWAGMAREAAGRIERDADAIQKLQSRRNESGQ